MQEHLVVVDAVLARAPDLAGQAMRVHLTSVIGALRRLSAMGVVGTYALRSSTRPPEL